MSKTLDKNAIRTVLRQMGEATYPDIALRAGEGLADPLMEMYQSGEVVSAKKERDGRSQVFYSLKPE